ncbi:MAG: phosphatidate cytidylyltransferase, partial [Ignavibacteria bacterium]
MSNTTVRLIVGLIGIPAIISLVVLGNYVFLTFCVLMSLLCMNEFYNLFERPKSNPSLLTKWAMGFSLEKIVFLIVSSLVVICFYFERFNYVLILFFIMFVFLIISELYKAEKHFEAIGTWLLSIVYISAPFGLLSLMASEKFIVFFGANFALICLILIWVSDTFAFWGGRSFGKHKLAESISPK